MSDFDFNELDKAVTGALGNDVPSSQPEAPEPIEPQETTPAPVIPASEPVKQTTPPAIRRGSGRFMDVVHPSSDMRSSSRPARGAFTPPATTSANNEPLQSAEAPLNDEVAPSEGSQQDDASSVVGEWSKPLESPFLPDAKVEKRPLGGSADTETFAAMLEETSKEPLLEAPDEPRLEAMTMPDPIDFAAQTMALPFENEDTGEQKIAEEPVVEENPLGLIEDDVDGLKLATSIDDPQSVGSPEPVGPTSITQQYTEQTSVEQTSGAIYDTENYHQPLAHDSKKHSSVWTILGIILLVILGAGAGVAFYFFVLPTF